MNILYQEQHLYGNLIMSKPNLAQIFEAELQVVIPQRSYE